MYSRVPSEYLKSIKKAKYVLSLLRIIHPESRLIIEPYLYDATYGHIISPDIKILVDISTNEELETVYNFLKKNRIKESIDIDYDTYSIEI